MIKVICIKELLRSDSYKLDLLLNHVYYINKYTYEQYWLSDSGRICYDVYLDDKRKVYITTVTRKYIMPLHLFREERINKILND